MADPSAPAGKAKGWTPDEDMELIFTILRHNNPELAVSGWNEVTEEMKKKYPDKTIRALQTRWTKIRAPYVVKGGGGKVADIGKAAKAGVKGKATKKRALKKDGTTNSSDGGFENVVEDAEAEDVKPKAAAKPARKRTTKKEKAAAQFQVENTSDDDMKV